MVSGEKNNKCRAKRLIWIVSVLAIVFVWNLERSKHIPQYGAVFYGKGVNCKEGCSPRQRLRYFQKAVSYQPFETDAFYQMALIYEDNGERDKAYGYLKKAMVFDRWNNMVFYKAGLYAYNEGDYERARRYFLQAAKFRIGLPDDMNYYLARSFDRLNEYDSAIEYYLNLALFHTVYEAEAIDRVVQIYYDDLGEEAFNRKVARIRHIGEIDLADQLESHFNAFRETAPTGQKR